MPRRRKVDGNDPENAMAAAANPAAVSLAGLAGNRAVAGLLAPASASRRVGSPPEPEVSAGLALRDRARAQVTVQRDIAAGRQLQRGRMILDFKKQDAAAVGDAAGEVGTVTFRPNAKAPESSSIRMIQIVRSFDVPAAKDFDWSAVKYPGQPGTEGARNKTMTVGDKKAGVQPGFYVDSIAGSLAPRARKSDPPVMPFYDVTGPPIVGNKTGERKGATTTDSVLADAPMFFRPIKLSFETSAKGEDNGVWYGTALWGFETYLDKAGVPKVRAEWTGFRDNESPTLRSALKLFDDYYRNPGAANAPKK